MKILQDTIDGQLWHRVICQTEEEKRIAEQYLIPDATGAFVDCGDEKAWSEFQKVCKNQE